MNTIRFLLSGEIRAGTLALVVIVALAAQSLLDSGAGATGSPDAFTVQVKSERIVQVNLEQHPKISQYTDIDSSPQWFGKNACGLVAAAAAVGGTDWTPLVASIASAAGSDYSPTAGIQPSRYALALQQVFGSQYVRVLNSSSTQALLDELAEGNIVIVDIRVNETTATPSVQAPTFAHFARVLGIDTAAGEIYIENTLRGDPYWTLSLDEFAQVWEHPETGSTIVPDPETAEHVTRWAVILDRQLIGKRFAGAPS